MRCVSSGAAALEAASTASALTRRKANYASTVLPFVLVPHKYKRIDWAVKAGRRKGRLVLAGLASQVCRSGK